MTAFEIYLNREKLCVAGVGDGGVLSAIVDYVSRSAEERLELAVGGLVSANQDHLKWISQSLEMGDEITVKILKKTEVDPPKEISRHDAATELEHHKRYVMNAAKKLGWDIRVPE